MLLVNQFFIMLLMLAAISEQGICSKTAINFVVAKVLKKAEVSMSVYLRVCHLVVCCMYVYLSLCMVCSGMFMGVKARRGVRVAELSTVACKSHNRIHIHITSTAQPHPHCILL